MLVYLAKNKINGKKYVGYTTKTLEERQKNHLRKSKNKKNLHYFYLFPTAIRKYGFENFDWEILFESNNLEEVIEKEIFYIKKLNTISPYGYNLTQGGNGGIPCEETRLKISNSLKKYYSENQGIGKIKSQMFTMTPEERSNRAKKAWGTKRKKNYKKKPFFQKEESKKKMSITKNIKNKIGWINIKTNEICYLSCTKMSEKTGLSTSIFSHIKNKRQYKTKCGWKIIENDIK